MRITVRTLLGMLATLLILVWFGYRQLPPFLYHNGYEKAVLDWFPNSEYAKPAVNALAYELYQQTGVNGDAYIFVSSNGWSSINGSQTSTREQRAAVITELEKLTERYGIHGHTAELSFNLAKLYFWNNEWDRAEELMEKIGRKKGSSFIEELEWQKFSEMLASRHVQSGKTPSLEGVVTIGGKPVPNAFVFIQRADDTGYSSPPFLDYPITITDEKGQYRFYEQEPGEYQIGVGLLPEQLAGYHLSEATKKTVTIERGATDKYSIEFVPQIRTVSPMEREIIEGEDITFRWEPYEEAAYYQLFITTLSRDKDGKYYGSWTSSLSDQKHEGTSAVYSIKEAQEIYIGSGKSYGQDETVALSTTGLLGPLHAGGEFMWSVEAFDANGRKLSSSAGYYLQENEIPLFRISEEGMLEGDRLVIQARYKEAIAAYEREGDNDRALRVLARLTEQGITREDGDPEKALRYLERIQKPNAGDKALKEQLVEKMNKQQ